ncbi:MAG TPA: hypothetical protein VLT58_01675 [Polyangia bacterium]|nr:hypothetical protein [Polyangia bacterium]
MAVARTRRRRRAGKSSSGGALSSLRGGFRSVAHGVVGKGPERPVSRGRRFMGNLLTVLLLVVAVALLLRRFGVHRR